MKETKDYTYRSIRDERQYGFFWYSGLWKILRPVLVTIAVMVLVAGICMTVWNKLYGEFAAPVDTQDSSEYAFEITSGESLNRVSSNLEKAGLIRSKTDFKYYCDFAGMGQKIQVGSYTLRKDMTIAEIAELCGYNSAAYFSREFRRAYGFSPQEYRQNYFRTGRDLLMKKREEGLPVSGGRGTRTDPPPSPRR